MTSQIKIQALALAEEKLAAIAFDIYHDKRHHKAVFKNCEDIISREELNIDTHVLEVACMWHDVFKGRENEELLLRDNFLSLNIEASEIDKIIQIISEHSFGEKQLLEESKVLYDADKIELVSIERWELAIDAYKKGVIDLEIRDKYVKEWNRRMPLLMGHLNYKSSNEIFEKYLKDFKVWLKSIGRMDENDQFLSPLNGE